MGHVSCIFCLISRLFTVFFSFMAQLTLARWRGDTTFGLISRVLSTFWGCIVGMVIWLVTFVFEVGSSLNLQFYRYVSTGSGIGNAYGLAAATAVSSPFLFFGRLYWPGAPMTNIIFFVTIQLVRPLPLCIQSVESSSADRWVLLAEFAHSYWVQLLGLASCLGTPCIYSFLCRCLFVLLQRRFLLVVAGVAAAL